MKKLVLSALLSITTITLFGETRFDNIVLDQEEVRVAYEQLSQDEKDKIAAFFEELDALVSHFQEQSERVVEQHKDAVDLLKQLLNVEQLSLSLVLGTGDDIAVNGCQFAEDTDNQSQCDDQLCCDDQPCCD